MRARQVLVLTLAGLSVACTRGQSNWVDGLLAAGIVANLDVRMGDRSGEGVIGRPKAVTSDPQGRVWLVSEEVPHQISVFDANGSFEFVTGREGDGPGEFRSISALAARPDGSIVVFDIRSGRVSILGSDGGFLELGGINGSVVAAWPNENGWIAVARGGHPGNHEYPVAVHRTPHSVDAELGADPPGLEYDFYDFQRIVTWSPSGSLWVSPAFALHLEEWSAAGELLQTWEREPEWMPSGGSWHPSTPDDPPTPTLRALAVDSLDRLWAAVTVGQPEWYSGLGDPLGNPESGRQMWPLADIDEVFGTRIELMDSETRTVIRSGYTDEFFFSVLPDGRWVSYRENDSGVPRVLLWNVGLDTESPGSTS